MSDEKLLRRLAREAITAERIPADRPKGTWGGNGTGTPCDICGLPIPDDEIEFEVEFSQETARARSCCHLHSRCFAAWEFERHALEIDKHDKGANGRTHSHPTTDSTCLPAEDKVGSMRGRERDFKGEGGSA